MSNLDQKPKVSAAQARMAGVELPESIPADAVWIPTRSYTPKLRLLRNLVKSKEELLPEFFASFDWRREEGEKRMVYGRKIGISKADAGVLQALYLRNR